MFYQLAPGIPFSFLLAYCFWRKAAISVMGSGNYLFSFWRTAIVGVLGAKQRAPAALARDSRGVSCMVASDSSRSFPVVSISISCPASLTLVQSVSFPLQLLLQLHPGGTNSSPLMASTSSRGLVFLVADRRFLKCDVPRIRAIARDLREA